MRFFYMSFCDTTRPKGQQFLGATVVEARNAKAAHARSKELGVNPGGETAMRAIDVDSLDDLPYEALAFIDRFVPRDEVMAGGGESMADSEIEPSAIVCQTHNPRPED